MRLLRRVPVNVRTSAAAVAAAVAGLLMLAGCTTEMVTPTALMRLGEYGRARVAIHDRLPDRLSDRAWVLDRMRCGVLTLADGQTDSAGHIFEDVYRLLRTAGVNDDRTVASVVLNEDVKIWKGEPFEQALAMAYYGIQQAQDAQWDNLRAAADASLFNLKDLPGSEADRPTPAGVIDDRLAAYARRHADGTTERKAADDAGLDQMAELNEPGGYVVRPSNFTLGYLLRGLAAAQLGREDEASDHLAQAVRLEPTLAPLASRLAETDSYNLVLIVGYGLGPRLTAYGPDNSLARFVPRTPSDRRALTVAVGEDLWSTAAHWPAVQDTNAMARQLFWNNTEQYRVIRSGLGRIMFAGGTTAALYGLEHDDDTLAAAGAGAALAGLFLRAGAHADTRYCDVFAQRYYVVPLMIEPDPGRAAPRITLQVAGLPGTRLVLRAPPPDPLEPTQLRYVRLLLSEFGTPPPWAVAGSIAYNTPAEPDAIGPTASILEGGRSAIPPPRQDRDQPLRAAGYVFETQDAGGYAPLHVLEGGRSLVAPDAGTVGYARLFSLPRN